MDNKKVYYSKKKDNLLGQYAGFVSRITAFIIDTIIISIILIFSTWFITTTITIFQIDNIFATINIEHPFLYNFIQLMFSPITASVLSLLFIFIYYVFFWVFSGSSPGKSIMGIRIVPLNGKKMPLWRAALRYLAYYLSALPLGLGFFWIIIDDRRMAWHDRISRTCVIYTWEARHEEDFLKSALDHLEMRRDALQTYINTRKKIIKSQNPPSQTKEIKNQ